MRTTVGRVILSQVLPEELGFDAVNLVMDKKALKELVGQCYRTAGTKATVILSDRLKDMGYKFATKSGLSISRGRHGDAPAQAGASSTRPWPRCRRSRSSTRTASSPTARSTTKPWTSGPRPPRTWPGEMMEEISTDVVSSPEGQEVTTDSFNPIYMMADSGARGSKDQMKQLAGMRGLMAKPSGEIIETPITANFREGLTVLQYFSSTHGARKGLADTALKTANSGYLTRRLVDVSQDAIVTEIDCGTIDGIEVEALREGGEVIQRVGERVLGRTALKDITDPLDRRGA